MASPEQVPLPEVPEGYKTITRIPAEDPEAVKARDSKDMRPEAAPAAAPEGLQEQEWDPYAAAEQELDKAEAA